MFTCTPIEASLPACGTQSHCASEASAEDVLPFFHAGHVIFHMSFSRPTVPALSAPQPPHTQPLASPSADMAKPWLRRPLGPAVPTGRLSVLFAIAQLGAYDGRSSWTLINAASSAAQRTDAGRIARASPQDGGTRLSATRVSPGHPGHHPTAMAPSMAPSMCAIAISGRCARNRRQRPGRHSGR